MTVHAAEIRTFARARLGERIRGADAAAALLGAGAVLPIAAADGGYFAPTWGWATLALAWAACLAAVISRDVPIGRLDLAALAGIAGLAAWTATSALWAPSTGSVVLELQRTLVYVAALVAAVVVVRPSGYRALTGGVWASTALLASYALFTRLFPDALPVTYAVAANRLSTPIGYWNGLGLFVAMGAVLALGLFAAASTRIVRMLAGASLVPLTLTLYFTFSRGAWIALATGVVVTVAFEPRRLRFLASVGLAAPFAVVAVTLASQSGPLTTLRADVGSAAAEGERLFPFFVALAAGAAAAALGFAWLERRVEVPQRLAHGMGRALGLFVVAALAVVVVRLGGPVEMARDGWRAFDAPHLATGADLNRRLFSFSSGSRVQLWRVALDEAGRHPLTGAGAGTYERAWLEHRPAPVKVRDAHNLYLETLAELGPVGLGLLGLALVPPLVAAARARRRPLVAATAGAYTAFLVHAAGEWHWELPAVTVTALLAGAACLAAARGEPAMTRRTTAAIVTAAIVICVPATAGLLANRPAHEAAAALEGDGAREAEVLARRATVWAPWSARNWRLLGEAQLQQGQLAEARGSFRRGLAKDPGDWELWLDLAFASERPAARRAAAEQALRLNPRSPEIAPVRAALGLPPERSGP